MYEYVAWVAKKLFNVIIWLGHSVCEKFSIYTNSLKGKSAVFSPWAPK
jgi:hypothetical protein